MFIRTTSRTYKDKTYVNHLLVESIHTPKGPRQRTVCSLGNLKPRPRSEWLKLAHKVEEALVGQGELFEESEDEEVRAIVAKVKAGRAAPCPKPHADGDDVVEVLTDQAETEEPREAGPVHVGYAFWKRLGLDEILREQGLGEHTRTLASAMVLNRLVAPSSEHAMPDWIRTTALEDIVEADFSGLAEDALYRTMDKLGPHRGAIESALAEREADLFNLDGTVFSHDVTSTYFEGGAAKTPKAKRGYWRAKRPDCKQVVVGLAVNRDGFPLAHEVLEGNTQDRATLAGLLDVIDARVGLREGQTVVVDHGMASAENLETLRNHPKKLHYIVATRQCERDQFLAEFEDPTEFEEVLGEPSPTNPFQKQSRICVKRKRHDGETFILCLSSERAEKDRAIREHKEQRIARRRLVKPVKIGEDQTPGRRPRLPGEEKRRQAEKLDGAYLLRTDREDLGAEEAWRIYMLLTRAEDVFRDMTSPHALQAIYHQAGRRVDTHIFLSLLAYHLLTAIEKTLLDQGVHTSWHTVGNQLKTHQVYTVVLPTSSGAVLRIRKGSKPEPQHKEIYELLNVPEQIMKPIKTWSEPATTP